MHVAPAEMSRAMNARFQGTAEGERARGDLALVFAPELVVADELAARVSQAQALAELGEIVAHAEHPEGLVRVAVHVVARGLGAAIVAIVQPDDDGALHVRSSTSRSLVETRLRDRGSLAAVALDTGAPAAQDALSPLTDPELTSGGAASAVCVPLSGGTRAVGVLCACSAVRRAFDASEIQFLQIAANVLGACLARHAAIREIQAMQARLALADRLLASATVAAGLAHEINNPLAVVTSNVAWVEEVLGDLPQGAALGTELRRELCEALYDARRSADRMRDLIRDLRALNRVDESDLAGVPLGPLVRACASIVSAEVAGRAKLVLDLDGAPPVHGNEARLGQVFLNLLVNAAHAIPRGRPDSNEVSVVARREDGMVCIEVRDTGRGIAADQLERLFEPFVASVAPCGTAARGRGLGLAICHQIVTSIGGAIEVESAVGKGSTFRIRLRMAPPEALPGHLARTCP
jgi:signal transduction histidine kinase